jgi:hypothetical protein
MYYFNRNSGSNCVIWTISPILIYGTSAKIVSTLFTYIIYIYNDLQLLVVQGISKRVLQLYSKCCCVASVTKTFTLKGVQIIHRSTPYHWKSHWTVTIPGETPCILLHYGSSKHCTCPLNKFTQAFKVVKLFFKHPALPVKVKLSRDYPR